MMDSGVIEAADGCRIAWRSDGSPDAPALVLSNSLGADMSMWMRQVDALAKDYRVLRYDQRGHGASGVPEGAAKILDLGRDVLQLMDRLKIEKAHFCGVSLGGMTGQWLLQNAPARFDRMILCFTSPYMGPPEAWQGRMDTVLTQGLGSIIDPVMSRWLTPGSAQSDPDGFACLRVMLSSTPDAGYAACCAAIRDLDLRPGLKHIENPVLVIGGDQDPAVPIGDSQSLANNIPQAELAVLPCAHLGNFECAEAFNALVAEFLGRD